MSKLPKLLVACLVFSAPVNSEPFGLGRTALPIEIKAWNTDIRPDGAGLPVGSGNASKGEVIFAEKCADCHGEFGEGVGRWPPLAGGQDSLTSERPLKTLGSYWPYLSTSWDYIYRAMPYGDAGSLTVDETYAIVAYILLLNDLVDDERFTLTDRNFTKIKLANKANFKADDRPKTEYKSFIQACMINCKSSAKITRHATGKDVTPQE